MPDTSAWKLDSNGEQWMGSISGSKMPFAHDDFTMWGLNIVFLLEQPLCWTERNPEVVNSTQNQNKNSKNADGISSLLFFFFLNIPQNRFLGHPTKFLSICPSYRTFITFCLVPSEWALIQNKYLCLCIYGEQVTRGTHTHAQQLLPNYQHPERDLIWIKARTRPMWASPVCMCVCVWIPYVHSISVHACVSIHVATMVLYSDLDKRKDVIDITWPVLFLSQPCPSCAFIC